MKVTVAPASTKTGRAAVERLLTSNLPELTVVGIYRDVIKAPDNFKKSQHFEARQGDLASPETLDFSGSDVVIAVLPPLWSDPAGPVSGSKRLAENVEKAVRSSETVRRLVYVSSMGAQYEKGTGEIASNRVAEQTFAGVAPEVVFIRCAYFMENFAFALETIQADPPFFCSTISPASHAVPMVSANDVGVFCASQSLSGDIKPLDEPHITELQGPRDYSSLDAQKALQEVTGRQVDLRVVEPDDVASFMSCTFPPGVVPLFVEMNATLLPGSPFLNDPTNTTPVHRGTDTLVDSFRRMLQQLEDVSTR